MTEQTGAPCVAPDRTPHGRPTIGIPGQAAIQLTHRPSRHVAPTGRPDSALVERDHPRWNVLGASTRGVQHSLGGEPRQDAFGLAEVGDTVYSVVCDGVGEFRRSHEAADLAVDTLLAHLDEGHEVPDAIAAANEGLLRLDEDGKGPRATTLLVAAVRPIAPPWLAVDLWWVGDPYAWALLDGAWTLLNPAPATSSGLFSTASLALPMPEPVVHTASMCLRCDGVFFMTDGVGQPMETIVDVRDRLASWWTAKPSIFEFAGQVSFARQSHTDDRTVVGLWPTRVPADDDDSVADGYV
jgi:hypothetical protein